jgi:hypothetical protein
MPTVIAFHEVDDVDHWLSQPTRDEFFGSIGITHRTFVEEGTNRVGLILEVPDLDALEAAMQTGEAAEAMKNDGVRPETLVLMAER